MQQRRFVTVLVLLTSLLFITDNYGEDISESTSNEQFNSTEFSYEWLEHADNRSSRGYWFSSRPQPYRQNNKWDVSPVREPSKRIGPAATSVSTTAVEPVRVIQTRSDGYSYQPAAASYSRPTFFNVDFSPLFVALIPIALFLGAAAALALAVATTPNTAVATAQQQQQQQEGNNNNNNANNANNNLMTMLASLFAASYTQTNTYNNQNYPFIIPINSTAYAIYSYSNGFPYFFIVNNGSYFIGRSSKQSKLFKSPSKINFKRLTDT